MIAFIKTLILAIKTYGYKFGFSFILATLHINRYEFVTKLADLEITLKYFSPYIEESVKHQGLAFLDLLHSYAMPLFS